MPAATISLQTKFNLSVSPKMFNFLDTTDWASYGIAVADVNGCLTIESPGSFPYYTNNDFTGAGCDINIAVDLNNQIPIQLPLIGGVVQPGDYKITYRVYNSDTDEYYTQEYNFTFEGYTSPEVCIEQTWDCISPWFKSLDTTNYAKAGATLVLIRSHKLYFPVSLSVTTITTAAPEIMVGANAFYEGVQTTTIGSSVEYTFEDGLIVLDYVTGSKEALVDCASICELACCLKTLEQKMRAKKGYNDALYAEYAQAFYTALGYVTLITQVYVPCGLNNLVDDCVAQIKEIGHCDDACRCSDTPAPISGLGASGFNTVVESGGEPVVVTSSVDGGTTTYTVTINPAFVALVNSFYNVVVEAGANITVTSATGMDGTITYTVAGVSPTVQIANSVFVAKNGNDSTGLVERLDKPFLTYAAARAAALAYWTGGTAPSATNRILIKIFSGLWEEALILADYVDLDLTDGVYSLNTGERALITDNSSACNCIIYGNAELIRGNADAIQHVLHINNASSNVILYANKARSYNQAIYNENGTSQLFINSVVSTNSRAVRIIDGSCTIEGGDYSSSSAGSSAQAVTIAAGILIVKNAKLSSGGGSNKEAVLGVGGNITINNCVLVADGSAESIVSTNDVKIYGRCVSNKTTTATLLVGTIANDGYVVSTDVS